MSEVWEFASQDEMSFSILVISATAVSIYLFPSMESFATTVTSKRLPINLRVRLQGCCAIQAIEKMSTNKVIKFFKLLGKSV
jgi:hypothetical protein